MPKIKQWNGTSWVTFDASNANSVPFSGITSKPTTLSGYGITDGVSTASNITLTGALTLSGDPTSSMHAATKQYVDNKATGGGLVKKKIYDDQILTQKANLFTNNREKLPTSRIAPCVEPIGNTIYVIGGAPTTSTVSQANEAYDILTGTWTTKANMTTARKQACSAVSGNTIYVIGGTVTGTTYLQTNEAYDSVNNTWSSKTNMTTGRFGCSCGIVNGVIYVLGGSISGTANSTINEAYDVSLNSWSTKTAMATGKYEGTASVVSGIIYHIGGQQTVVGVYGNVNEAYDPVANTWTTKAAMTTGRWGLTSQAYGSVIYCLSGATASVYNLNQAYDTSVNTWSTKTSLTSVTRYLSESAIVNGVIYIAGGYNVTNALDNFETYDVLTNTTNYTKKLRPMHIARSNSTCQAVGNTAYVIGGSSPTDNYLQSNLAYDSVNNTWTVKTNMTSGRNSLGSGVVGSTIYCIGGDSFSGGAYSTYNEAYDTTLNTWSTKASMTTGRNGLTCSVIGTTVYAIGGYNAGGYLGTVEAYDTVNNTWSSKTSMTTARNGLTSQTVNGKIYAIGGYGSTGFLTNVEEYDPSGNSWTGKSAMPTGRNNLASVVYNGKIIVMGGYASSGYSAKVEVFDPSGNSWITRKDLPYARNSFSACIIGEMAYMFGGFNPANLFFNHMYDVVNDLHYTNQLPITKNMTTARDALTSGIVGNFIYCIGGNNGTSYVGTNEAYDVVNNTWTTKTSMPTARGYHSSVTVDDIIYCIGGFNGTSNLSTNESYNPATDTWSTKASMPTARRGFGACKGYNGLIYCIGGTTNGTSGLTTNESYNPSTNSWTTNASMSSGLFGMTIYNIDNTIYIMSGTANGTTASSAATSYNIITNTYGSTSQGGFYPRFYHTTAFANRRAFHFGGYNGSSTYLSSANSTENYLINTSVSGSIALPVNVALATSQTFFAFFYVIGGNTAFGKASAVQVFQYNTTVSLEENCPTDGYSYHVRHQASYTGGLKATRLINGTANTVTASNEMLTAAKYENVFFDYSNTATINSWSLSDILAPIAFSTTVYRY